MDTHHHRGVRESYSAPTIEPVTSPATATDHARAALTVVAPWLPLDAVTGYSFAVVGGAVVGISIQALALSPDVVAEHAPDASWIDVDKTDSFSCAWLNSAGLRVHIFTARRMVDCQCGATIPAGTDCAMCAVEAEAGPEEEVSHA